MFSVNLLRKDKNSLQFSAWLLGSTLTNQFYRKANDITQSTYKYWRYEYALRVNFQEADQIHNLFYLRIAEGENEYVSISTVDKLES